MKRRLHAVILGAQCLVLCGAVYGQIPPASAVVPVYSALQLEQMLAPIALYPDPLLGPLLMASTYPLEIVEADRWLQNDANASLQGAQLAEALRQQSWDRSVKALIPFPQLLNLLDNDLDWTEQLGDAFLAQQSDVMDAIQRLRVRAQAAGTLKSSPQEAVVASGQDIEIAPAEPEVVYVPVYDPLTVYGQWPSALYPPDEFTLTGYPFGSFIGVTIVAPLWGWQRWDWSHHRLEITRQPGHGGSPSQSIPWQHDPARRAGVPYGDPGIRVHFYAPGAVPPSVRSPLTMPSAASMSSSAAPPARAALPQRSEPRPNRITVERPVLVERREPLPWAPASTPVVVPRVLPVHAPDPHSASRAGAATMEADGGRDAHR